MKIFFLGGGYLDLFSKLEDSESKEILARILLFRVTFEMDLNQGIRSTYPDYLDEDIISLKEDEVIIDLGGYVGDTLFDFMEYFQDRDFKGEYYLFEPIKELCQEASLLTSCPNVHYCDLCAGEENNVVIAEDSNLFGEYSSVNKMVKADRSNKLENTMPMVRLDDFMEGKKISYIKMDIEGAEKDAINGARELIKRNTPKLAVCLYHKYEDIRELFSLVDSLGNYKYYIRAQRNSVVTEYVMYAIPKEKQYEK